jgi:predicted metal-dependent phosphoesterase TrpH
MQEFAKNAANSSEAPSAATHPGVASMLVDLHSHSRYSDGTATLEDIETACLKRRIGVALTDHNEIRGAIRLCEHAKIASIPAIEVGTIEGLEFLIYFSDPAALESYYVRSVEPYLLSRFMVRSNCRSLAAIEEAQGEGGYVSLAHPFAPGRKSIDFHRRKGSAETAFVDRVLNQVDAIELFNGGVLRKSNTLAGEFSTGVEKPFTAGSDSHHLSTLGSCGIRFSPAINPTTADLFKCLATNGGTEVVTLQGRHFRTVPIIAIKHTLFFVRGRKANGRH